MGKDWRDPPPPPLGAAAHFAYSRVPRDRAWAVVFAVVWAGAVAGGVFAVLHRNAAAFLHTDFDDPASCPYTPNDAHRALLEAAAKKAEGDWSFGAFLHLAGGWLAVSAALALALGAAFVHLFKHHSGVMTRATIGAQVAVSVARRLMGVASWRCAAPPASPRPTRGGCLPRLDLADPRGAGAGGPVDGPGLGRAAVWRAGCADSVLLLPVARPDRAGHAPAGRVGARLGRQRRHHCGHRRAQPGVPAGRRAAGCVPGVCVHERRGGAQLGARPCGQGVRDARGRPGPVLLLVTQPVCPDLHE